MLTLKNQQPQPLCLRRDFLRRGSELAVGGFTITGCGTQPFAATKPATAPTFVTGGAKSCILVSLLGNPPHQDTFDLRPEASSEIRGPFQPIETSVSGLHICEHLPPLAGMAKTW